VLNHRCAGLQGPDGLWNQYTGKLDWDARAIVSDDPHFGGKGNRSSGDFFHAAPNIDHSQDFVKNDIIEWMRWLQREVGYDGWRLDYVRGFSGTHVKTYMESTVSAFPTHHVPPTRLPILVPEGTVTSDCSDRLR
jgi:hypothetical protein